VGAYAEAYRRSLADPEGFWLEAAGLVDWTVRPSAALDASRPPFYRWYPDGELNTCANALDRHVEVFWSASDIGWVVGHSYIVYAPLLAGATTVMYEGKPVGTPDAGAFWRVVQQHAVKTIFTAPTAIRAIKRADPDAGELAKYDTGALRSLFLAGERLDPETYHWAARALRVPGWDVRVASDSGEPVPPGQEGEIVIRLPLPPGAATTLWGDDERFVRSYLARFPGYYHTGDSGFLDSGGYLFVMGRTDDVINVAGHRLSTGAIEAALATHPAVAECAVIGVPDELKGPGRGRAPGRGPGRRLPRGPRGQRPAEDQVRQGPAQDHARDREREGRAGPGHDRGRLGPRRAHADSARPLTRSPGPAPPSGPGPLPPK